MAREDSRLESRQAVPVAFSCGGQRLRQTLPLTQTQCAFGGARLWFCCPNGRCGRRCATLYLGGRSFLCRRCLGLAYRTQHEQADGRLLLKAERIWRRLGCDFGDEPQRPKGMHRRTFERLSGSG